MRDIKDVIINGVNLEEILDKHEKWLKHKEDGERADLSGVDLSYVDLSCADLTRANLSHTNLRKADLSYTNLNEADLSSTNLCEANLKGADLINAKLRYANLSEANLTCVDLEDADLSHADLNYANLMGANLKQVNLDNVRYNECTSFFALQCPEEGSFIGYKKARGRIVKLLITEDAERSNTTTRKCRCSKAKVLSITNKENTKEYNKVRSDFDYSFIYKVGEIVEVKAFDKNRWEECSTGIHFFMTRDEAVKYQI